MVKKFNTKSKLDISRYSLEKFTKYYYIIYNHIKIKLGCEFLEDKSTNCHERLDTWNYQQSLFLLRKV